MQGKTAAQGFYEYLSANLKFEHMDATRSYYGDDFCVVEHLTKEAVTGEFLAIPRHGREITFRLLHIWEFRDGQHEPGERLVRRRQRRRSAHGISQSAALPVGRKLLTRRRNPVANRSSSCCGSETETPIT